MPRFTVSLVSCYLTHPHTHAHRATDDGGGGDLGSHGEHGERPVVQCTMGLVVMVIVGTGLHYACGRWGGGRGLTALRPFFDFRDLGVHLNGPLASDSI